MPDTTSCSPLNWIWNHFKSTKPTIVYRRLKNPSALQSLIWMHVRFMCKKRNNLWHFLIYVRLCDLSALILYLPYYLSVSAVLDFRPQFSLLSPGVHDILSDSFSNICSPISPPIPIVYFVPT